ncbi:MAG: Xaa-Pro peptidase family protein [Thermodesulfobacteriota bacterium]|nr:Xaa-Pro peptidase family protein [Thermodesulfobacteriota bacterium]
MGNLSKEEERVGRVRSALSRFEVEGILFFDMANIRYLTGFTGSEGALFIGEREPVLLIDGRYVTQAAKETKACEILHFTDKTEGIARLLASSKVRVAGFESRVLTYDAYEKLQREAEGILLKPLSEEIGQIRVRKDSDEIALLKGAAKIAAGALTATLEILRPGVSESNVASLLEVNMREGGSEKLSFETIVAAGDNSSMPHARPGVSEIQDGDFVVIDYGAVYRGYHSDETCTFAIGGISREQESVYEIVKNAHDRAIDAVRAGASCKEIDGIARDYIKDKGFGSNFSHGTGHGVGLEVHEAPTVSERSTDCLEEGMVITVEPGIYIPGKWGVRIEDTVLVERDGCEIITKMSKDLMVL